MLKRTVISRDNLWFSATVLGALAGIIYNSWPLGYWLNPYVARHDLASELEALHQPYNWLFISGDVLSSVLIMYLVILLWKKHQPTKSKRLTTLALVNLLLFAVGTIADTLVPLHCDPSVQHCAAGLHNPLLIAHGFFSIAASTCLFISVALVWWLRRRNPHMNTLLGGYVLLAIFSVISLVTPGQDSWAQHYALLLDGVCLAAIPYVLLQPSNC
jgi:hypothetical membrane protein